MTSLRTPIGLAAGLALLLSAAAPLHARNVSPKEFGEFLGSAAKECNGEDTIALQGGGYRPISELEVVDSDAAGGAVKFVIRQHANFGGGSVLIRGAEALIQNHLTSATFGVRFALPPDLSADWVDEILAEKSIQRIANVASNHDKNTEAEVSFQDGHFWVTAHYDYGNDNDYDVTDRYKNFMTAGRRLIEEVYKKGKEVRDDYWKSVEKKPVTRLDNGKLIAIIEHNLSEYAEDDEEALGHFSWWDQGERDLHMVVYEDRMVFAQHFALTVPDVGARLVTKAVNDLLAEKKDRRLPGADPMEAVVENGALVVRGVYPLAGGQYTGKDLREVYKKFDGDVSKKIHGDVSEILEEAGEDSWEATAALSPEYMPKKTLLYVAPWDISTAEGEFEPATEGFWEWTEGDTSVELWNTGEVVTVGFWRNLPDGLSSGDKDRIVAAVNEELQKHDIAHVGSPRASLYPGYDQVLWVAVEMPMGQYTNGQIRDVLLDFVDEWCRDGDKKVGKVIDKQS